MDIRIADALRELPNICTQSVDGVITDPPYGVSGKIEWDRTQITVDPQLWLELFRVLKPGAFLVCFADPRRFHQVASAAERAGFEIRTPLAWQYRAALPKTHKASRLIDVNAKVQLREIGTMNRIPINDEFRRYPKTSRSPTLRVFAPTSAEAKKFAGQYLGDGTMQRAGEPILLAQRPPDPGLKIDSLRRYQTGGINVEEYRTRYREWPTTVFNVPRPAQIEVAGCPHPTMKPVDLIRRWVLLFVPRGGTVLDPFAGSGTTGAAAILEGRRPILIERDRAMRVWIRRRIKSVDAATSVISVNRNKKSVEANLAAVRRAIERLDRVERRLSKIVAPYAARVTVEGIRLHLASLDQPQQWRALLERHGITLRQSAKSPCQGAARLMFERAHAVCMYAHAMAWGLDQVLRGHTTLEQLPDLIVEAGGVQAVADAFAKSQGVRPRIAMITNRDYERAVSRLPRAGILVGDAKIDVQEALALIRKDSKGRRVVHLIEADPHRVRAAVMRYSRQEELATGQKGASTARR